MAEHEASEDFEREKWRAEMALRERELALKEREGSLFKSPIVVSAIAVFVGLFSNAVSDWITKDRRLAEETRQREAALLVKAFEHNDPNVVMAKLNLLNLTGMISDANELAKKLAGQEYTEIESKIKSLPSESLRQYQAALIQKAIENDDLDKVLRKLKLLDEANLIPDYDKVRKVYATLTTIAALPVTQPTSDSWRPSIVDFDTCPLRRRHRPHRQSLRRQPHADDGCTDRHDADRIGHASSTLRDGNQILGRLDLPGRHRRKPQAVGGVRQRYAIDRIRITGTQCRSGLQGRGAVDAGGEGAMPPHQDREVPARRWDRRPQTSVRHQADVALRSPAEGCRD